MLITLVFHVRISVWGKSEREGGRKGKRISHRDKLRGREREGILECWESK